MKTKPLVYSHFKDTKKRTTWWCLADPIIPTIAINIKIEPHIAVPMRMCGSEKKARVFDAIANPIRIRPSIWEK